MCSQFVFSDALTLHTTVCVWLVTENQ